MLARLAGVFLVVAAACHGGDEKGGHAAKGRSPRPEPAAGAGAGDGATRRRPDPVPLPMGKAELSGYAYSRGPARPAFRRALAAARKADWKRAASACREALLLDRGHLEAHWLLALALAAQERYEEVLDPLSAAVAGDWQRWGERSLTEPKLAGFRESPAGRRYAALAEQYRERFRAGVGGGLLVVGRRGEPWVPRRSGDTAVNHRSELYAYDLDAGRYLRVSRTGGSLVGLVRAPDGRELAYAAYRKVRIPPEDAPGEAVIRTLRVGTIDLETAAMSETQSVLSDVRAAQLYYGGEGEPALYARVTRAGGASALFRLDPAAGRAREETGAIEPRGRVLHVAYDAAELRQPEVEGVAADWDRERSAGAFRLLATRKTITVPDGAVARRDSLRWSPERSRLSFAVRAGDPCSENAEERRATLYAVDATTGRLHPVATGDGPFEATWLDESRLAYVDRSADEVSVRLVDVTSGSELAFLETRGGLEVLPSAQRCRPARPSRDAPEPPPDTPEEP